MGEPDAVTIRIDAINATQEALRAVNEGLKGLAENVTQLSKQAEALGPTFIHALHDPIGEAEHLGTTLLETFGTIGEAAAGTVAAITGITAAIVTLAIKGSDVDDLERSFGRLAGGAANAELVLGAMRDGVKGTVSDMTLMTDANRLLSLGMKANADDFGALTKGALQLANEGFGSVETVMTQLDRAMMTGNQRMLTRLGLQVDLDTAERKYAANLGLHKDALDRDQKAAADRGAILEVLKKKVDAAGDSELSFKMRIDATLTSIANWTEHLEQVVSKSTSVNAALKTIQDAWARTFSGAGQALLDTIVAGITHFADLVRENGPAVIDLLGQIAHAGVAIWQDWAPLLGELAGAIASTFGAIVREWGPKLIDSLTEISHVLRGLIDLVREGWDLLPGWFKDIASTAVEAAAAVWLVDAAVKALGFSSGLLGGLSLLTKIFTTWSEFGFLATLPEWLTSLGAAIEGLSIGEIAAVGLGLLGDAMAAIAASPLLVPGLFVALIGGLVAVAGAFKDLYKAWQDGQSMWDFFFKKRSEDELDWLSKFMRHLMGLGGAARDAADELDRLQKASLARTHDIELIQDQGPKPEGARLQADIDREAAKKRFATVVDSTLKSLEGDILDLPAVSAGIDAMARSMQGANNVLMANEEVRKRVTAAMDKETAAGRTLSAQQEHLYAQILQVNEGVTAHGLVQLRTNTVTEQTIASLRAQGMSEEHIAHVLDTTVDALKRYETELKARNALEDDVAKSALAHATAQAALVHPIGDADQRAAQEQALQLEALHLQQLEKLRLAHREWAQHAISDDAQTELQAAEAYQQKINGINQAGEDARLAILDKGAQARAAVTDRIIEQENAAQDALLAAQEAGMEKGLAATLRGLEQKAEAEDVALQQQVNKGLLTEEAYGRLKLEQQAKFATLEANARKDAKKASDDALFALDQQYQTEVINLHLDGVQKDLALLELSRQAQERATLEKIANLEREKAANQALTDAQRANIDQQIADLNASLTAMERVTQAKAQAIVLNADPAFKAIKEMTKDMRDDWAATWEKALNQEISWADAALKPFQDLQQGAKKVFAGLLADLEQQLLSPFLNMAHQGIAAFVQWAQGGISQIQVPGMGGQPGGGPGQPQGGLGGYLNLAKRFMPTRGPFVAPQAGGTVDASMWGGEAAESGGTQYGPMAGGYGGMTTEGEVPDSLAAGGGAGGGMSAFGWGSGASAGIGMGAGMGLGMAADLINTGPTAGTGAIVAHDAMKGASYGAMFGPVGMGIGAGVGAIVGAIRAGAEWRKTARDIMRDFVDVKGKALEVSEEFAKKIEQTEKDEGLKRVQAITLNLHQLIQEAGGLTDKNLDTYVQKTHDAFTYLTDGSMKLSQVTQVLDDNFADLAKAGTDSYGRLADNVQQLITLNDHFGTQSKAITEYLKGQGQLALQGFVAVADAAQEAQAAYDKVGQRVGSAMGGLLGADPATAAIAQRIQDAKKAQDQATQAGDLTGAAKAAQDIKDATAELDTALPVVKEFNDALKDQATAAAGAKEELSDLGLQAVGAYTAAVASGTTPAEALAALSPTLLRLKQNYIDLGLEIDDVALRQLTMQAQVQQAAPTLLKGIAGLNQEMVALDNMGLMTGKTFESMERTARTMYVRLQGEVAKVGGTTADALAPMQDYLHQAVIEAEKLHEPLDANTQEMLDQSKALGLWKDDADKAKTPIDKLVDSVQKLIDTLNHVPGTVDVDINVNKHTTETTDQTDTPQPETQPPLDTAGMAGGGVVPQYLGFGGIGGAFGAVSHAVSRAAASGAGALAGPFAGGPRGTDTVPTWLTPGEGVVSTTGMAALDAINRGDFGGNVGLIGALTAALGGTSATSGLVQALMQTTTQVAQLEESVASMRRAVEQFQAVDGGAHLLPWSGEGPIATVDMGLKRPDLPPGLETFLPTDFPTPASSMDTAQAAADALALKLGPYATDWGRMPGVNVPSYGGAVVQPTVIAGDTHNWTITTVDATGFDKLVTDKIMPAMIDAGNRGKHLTSMKQMLGVA